METLPHRWATTPGWTKLKSHNKQGNVNNSNHTCYCVGHLQIHPCTLPNLAVNFDPLYNRHGQLKLILCMLKPEAQWDWHCVYLLTCSRQYMDIAVSITQISSADPCHDVLIRSLFPTLKFPLACWQKVEVSFPSLRPSQKRLFTVSEFK